MSEIKSNHNVTDLVPMGDFNGKRKAEERKAITELVNARKTLEALKKEFVELIEQNPDIAEAIQEYFKVFNHLDKETDELQQKIAQENGQSNNDESRDTKPDETAKKLEEVVNDADTLDDLKQKKRNFLLLVRKIGKDTDLGNAATALLNDTWDKALENNNFEMLNELFRLVEKYGLEIGCKKFEDLNQIDLIKEKTQEILWECLKYIEFLKLFDPVLLSSGLKLPIESRLSDLSTDQKLMYFKLLGDWKLRSIMDENAALSEKLNTQVAANQNALKAFRNRLIEREQNGKLLVDLEKPKSWEELRARFNQFLEKHRVFELLDQAKPTEKKPKKIEPPAQSKYPLFLSNKFENVRPNLSFTNDLPPVIRKSINLNGLIIVRKEGGFTNLFSGSVEDSLEFYYLSDEDNYFSTNFTESPISKNINNNFKFKPSISKGLKISIITDLDSAYLFMHEAISKFGFEF